MNDSPYIFEVTRDNFEQVVMANSRRVPVLVDFWAAWCAPCQMLMPLLAGLAEEYQGKLILAKVNTDEQQDLAARFGVRSLPTVALFKNEALLDQFMGAQPESVIRRFIEPHLNRPSDSLLDEAVAARGAGDFERAAALLTEAAALDPGRQEIQRERAWIAALQGEIGPAQALLASLRGDAADSVEFRALRATLTLLELRGEVPDETALARSVEAGRADPGVRLQWAAHLGLAGRHDEALETFLEVMRGDPSFRDHAPRQGMMAVFDLLGGEGELVARYRRQMANLLY